MFHAVSVGPALHLSARDLVPPVKTENFLQLLSMVVFKSFEMSTVHRTGFTAKENWRLQYL